MAKEKRPCMAAKKGSRACFWQEASVCACYQPHARKTISGERFPELSPIELVPLDFCKENYIPIVGQDQYFQRNTALLAYREKTSKQKERSVGDSGSSKEKKEDLSLF